MQSGVYQETDEYEKYKDLKVVWMHNYLLETDDEGKQTMRHILGDNDKRVWDGKISASPPDPNI